MEFEEALMVLAIGPRGGKEEVVRSKALLISKLFSNEVREAIEESR